MFFTSGLFADIKCPFAQCGYCERPYCLYKHDTEAGNTLNTSKLPRVEFSGVQNGRRHAACEPSVNNKNETKANCHREMEQINKDIETLRHEVEQEQQRLSQYQAAQGEKFGTTGKTENGGFTGQRTYIQSTKYVVDKSKPKTDLLYDPLSNFSADLQTFSSSCKEQKVKNRQVVNRERSIKHCDQKEPVFPTSPSLNQFNDSDNDCVLIVGLSSSNKTSPVKTPVDPVDCKPSQDTAGEERDNTASSSFLSHKNAETSLKATLDLYDYCWGSSQCELPSSVEKMNPLQPTKNSNVHKAPADDQTKQPQTMQQPAYSQWSPDQNVYSIQKTTQVQGNSNHTGPYQEQAEPASGGRDKPSLKAPELFLKDLAKADIIIISSDEELTYSDMDVSDSDPMEECYRIFMEENNDNNANEEQSEVSIGDTYAKQLDVNVTPETLLGKKRVSHESKHTEQPGAHSRPQPQVLFPLREPASSGFGSRPSVPSKIQQVQQRASMVTASVKAGQAFLSSSSQKQTQSTQQTPDILEPVQNAYLSFIPAEVGSNLHLILPEGAFPLNVAATSSPVTSVLTPISQVHMSSVVAKHTYQPPAAFPAQRCRPSAPRLIPAPARKPSQPTALHSYPTAASTTPQPSVQAPAKSASTKRKQKQQGEAAKVPHSVRQHYVNMFTEELLKTTPDVKDAFEKALAEERTVYNRSVNKLKYQSAAVNALKRLKSQTAVPFKNENEYRGQQLKGQVQLNPENLKGNAEDMALYESLKDYIVTDQTMMESNYPIQHPDKRGCAVLFADSKKVNTDPLKRICCRCGATYSVSQTGKHIRKEECNYHYGKVVKKKVPGGVESRYSCCEGVMGTPGCQVFKLHVHDSFSMEGFVSTEPRSPTDTHCPGVYSLDCEMCYTVHGLELSRVTVVDSSLQVVFDTFVRPDNEVIDYNTRFSGISEEDVKSNHTSLKKVQETLLSFINTETILIGHSLEKDLCLLKLFHEMVVDTSVVFPHRLGPPYKRNLKNLTAEYLRRIIQESVCGHDTAEDATASMELMLWKVKDDGKMKK